MFKYQAKNTEENADEEATHSNISQLIALLSTQFYLAQI